MFGTRYLYMKDCTPYSGYGHNITNYRAIGFNVTSAFEAIIKDNNYDFTV